jgi:hypothetical protein
MHGAESFAIHVGSQVDERAKIWHVFSPLPRIYQAVLNIIDQGTRCTMHIWHHLASSGIIWL